VIEIEPTHKSPENCRTQNLYFIINIILHINTISNVLWPRPMLYRLPFFAFPFLWLQIMHFIPQTIVGFDEFTKVQAGRARHSDVFVVISRKFRFWLAVWHHSTSNV